MKKQHNIPIRFTFPKCFGFYLQLLEEMRAGKAPSYEVIHSAGGRNCGKTYCFTLFAVFCFYYKIKVIIFAFRKKSAEVADTIWQEFLNRFDDTRIPKSLNKTRWTITNGVTKIICNGLYNPKGEQVVKKGIAGCSNYTYAICWYEEASEYLEKDIWAVDQAVRGAKYDIKVFTTNPWHLAHYYIKYLNTKFPFNRKLLASQGYQWTVLGKELFHYANYRVNKFITAQKAKELEDMKFQDENEWKIISLGLPGVPSGGVYANLMKHVSRLIQPGDIYSCGIDFGFVHDPMAIILCRSQKSVWNSVDVLAELYFKNQSQFTWLKLAVMIVKWLKIQAIIYPDIPLVGLDVYCDKSNFTFIEMLNYEAQIQAAGSWLRFYACPQIEILFRVSFKQGLIGASKLNISPTTEYLFQELLMAAWDTKSVKPKLLREIQAIAQPKEGANQTKQLQQKPGGKK